MAKQRGWKLATDDRKARRLAGDMDVSVLTTPEIMRKWSEVIRSSPKDIAETLRNIAFGACFVPAVNMPEYTWWVTSLEAS